MFDVDNVWALLTKSPAQFHLTGSRYFGWATPGSDWDFFVQADKTIEDHLAMMGFSLVSKNSYADPLCLGVWTHPSNVHVQVVSSIKTKKRAQAVIQEHDLLNPYDNKQTTHKIWQAVILSLLTDP